MNILVTGVSKGLGLSICEKLLSDNHAVFGISRTMTEELDGLLSRYKGQLNLKLMDLSSPSDIKKSIFTEFISSKTELHAFINNAALAYDDIITNLNFNQLSRMYAVNVFSPMMITKYSIRNMLLHRTKGSIIHISSISAHTGYKGLAMYASSKGAIEAFSKNTAREWGERGIRSNVVVPGFMETSMSSTLSQEQKNRIYKRTSLKAPTCVQSVAETVLFLLSDKSSSITGQNIFVDSGTI